MEVKYKGQLFTKILAEHQKHATTVPSLASGQIVKLICDNTRDPPHAIHVHKTLLVAGSPMMERLLLQDDSVCPCIIIPDFDIAVVEKFSRMFYHGRTYATDTAEAASIRKLAEVMGFRSPSLSKKKTSTVGTDEVSIPLHYSKIQRRLPSTLNGSNSQKLPCSVSNNIASTPVLKQNENWDHSQEQSSDSDTEDRSAHKGKQAKRRRKKRKKLGTVSTASTSPEVDSDFVPDAKKSKILPAKIKSNPIDSSKKQASTKAKTAKSNAPKTTRLLRGSGNPDDLDPTIEDWNQFIKCYFCSASFDSEADLISHLTTSSCGKHLLGHLSFDTKFCDFCLKETECLTCWGYLKHLDLCHQEFIARSRRQSVEISQIRRGNGSSDETIPKRSCTAGGRTRRIMSSSDTTTSSSDSEIEVDAQPIQLKPLRIHPSAMLSISDFKAIRKQYEVLAEIRKKKVLASVQSFVCSPAQKSSSEISSTSDRIRQGSTRIVEKVEIEETEMEDVDDNMTESFSNNEDDFVPPTISNVCTISSAISIINGSRQDEQCSESHDAKPEVEVSGEKETNTGQPKCAEINSTCEKIPAMQTTIPIVAGTIQETAKILSVMQHTVVSTMAAPNGHPTSDSEVEILSEATSSTTTQSKSKRAKQKHRQNCDNSDLQSSKWDSLLLEAVKRLRSQPKRPTTTRIVGMLHTLSLSENENYPIYPIFTKPLPLTKRIQLVQNHLKAAVKRGLLLEMVKNEKMWYLPSDARKKVNSSSTITTMNPTGRKKSPQAQRLGPSSPHLEKDSGIISAGVGGELVNIKSNKTQNIGENDNPVPQPDSDDVVELPIESTRSAHCIDVESDSPSPSCQDATENAEGEPVLIDETIVNTLTFVRTDDAEDAGGNDGEEYKCSNPNCGMIYQDPLKFETHLCRDYF